MYFKKLLLIGTKMLKHNQKLLRQVLQLDFAPIFWGKKE